MKKKDAIVLLDEQANVLLEAMQEQTELLDSYLYDLGELMHSDFDMHDAHIKEMYMDYKAGTIEEREMVFSLVNIAIARDIALDIFPNIEKLTQRYRRFALIDFNTLIGHYRIWRQICFVSHS